MKKIQEADLEFHFTDAISVVKFDDEQHSLSHCMKAVDFIVDLPNTYLFVEVKDPSHPKSQLKAQATFQDKLNSGDLRKEVVTKFRDSFLYHWAEKKIEKPIHYIALITLEQALLQNFQDDLQRHLPHETKPQFTQRWSRQIANSCVVLNLQTWNRNFPKWPVRRVSSSAT